MNYILIGTTILIVVLIIVQIYLRRIWFYRDPKRDTPAQKGIIVTPADGQIIYIKEVNASNVVSEKLGKKIDVQEISKSDIEIADGYLIGIYMSPLDVHYNYAPIDGTVQSIKHTQAKTNLPMVDLLEYIRITFLRRAIDLFDKKFHFQNERNTIFIKGDISLAMVEIADKFVNKITCFVKEGQNVKIGQKLAFIERGSQVDLFIPKECKVCAEVGNQVFGGLTVLATYNLQEIQAPSQTIKNVQVIRR